MLAVPPLYRLCPRLLMGRAAQMLGYVPDLFGAERALVFVPATHNSMYDNTCILLPETPLTFRHARTHTHTHTHRRGMYTVFFEGSGSALAVLSPTGTPLAFGAVGLS